MPFVTFCMGRYIYCTVMKKNFADKVHFVGIGGIGMSALAQHLVHCGYAVSGSDRQVNEQTEKLQKIGIKVHCGHSEQNVKGACLVVRTSAVTPDNCEVAFAQKNNITVLLREQLLGEIFDAFKQRIAVCGTHGKTTVTAMIHHVLERCGVSHTAFIGGEYNKSNYFFGENIVVAEACEYNRSFLNLHPTICLCLNVEYDHPDCYKNFADVQKAFSALFSQSQKVILPSELQKMCDKAVLFGKNGSVQAKNVHVGRETTFSLYSDGVFACKCRLKVCGRHNVHNALAVFAVAKLLQLPLLQVSQALASFCGVDRRWTWHPECKFNVVCDYAHHPTEIAEAVQTALSMCKGRVFCVFQPHTYSRTKAFWQQFVTCFDGAQEVIYLPIFAAREKPQKGVSSFRLAQLARQTGLNAKYFSSFGKTAQHLSKTVKANDAILLIGAGDVNNLTKFL